MSFLSELFHGHLDWGNLSPPNLFKDTASSFANQPEWAKIAEIALPAVALGGVGLGALADVGVAGAAGGAAAEGGLAAADIGAGLADPTAEAIALDAAGTPAGVAAGAGAPLAGLSPSTYFGAAPVADAGGALPATSELAVGPANPFIAGGDQLPFVGPSGLTQTGAGGLPSLEGGTPGTVASADWSTAVSQPLIGGAGGAGAGGGATTGGDFAAVASAVDTAPPGLTTGITDPFNAVATATGPAPPGLTTGGATPSVLGQIGSTLKSAAPWLGAAGLGYNLFQGYQSQQALKQLQQQELDYQNKIAQAGQGALNAAQPLLATGQALELGGDIPPALQARFDQYRNAQRAQIIQGYGARGQNTDPLQNSALQQDLGAVDQNLLAMKQQLGDDMIKTANTMLSQGVSATQIAARLPMIMQQLDIQLQQLTSNSIANFAAAMSGGTMKVAGVGSGQNINLNLGGGALSPTAA